MGTDSDRDTDPTGIETTIDESGDRRIGPRMRATASHFWQRWIRMSRLRRAVAMTVSAAALGGVTFTACNSDSITGPSPAMAAPSGPSSSGTLLSSDDDSEYTYHQPEHKRKTQEEADADPDYTTTTETTFPVTEAVYNSCRNELVVLNGYLKSRLRIDADPLGSLRFQLREYKDTRGVYGEYTYEEDYYDDDDDSWKKRTKVVRYHNREFLLDQFKVGPADAPFRSEFISKMYLQREGPDPNYVKQYGDDLWVFVKQIMKVGTDGQVVVQHTFETECK